MTARGCFPDQWAARTNRVLTHVTFPALGTGDVIFYLEFCLVRDFVCSHCDWLIVYFVSCLTTDYREAL